MSIALAGARPAHAVLVRYARGPTWQGDAAAALLAAEQLLSTSPSAGSAALAWAVRARALASLRDAEGARRGLREAARHLEAAPRSADALLAQVHLDNELGRARAMAGQPGAAHDHFSRAVEGARGLGLAALLPVLLVNAGNTLARLGDQQGALALYEESLSLSAAGDERTEGLALHNLAILHDELHDTERAIACCQAADRAFAGQRPGVVDTLALLLARGGRLDEAAAAAEAGVALAGRLGSPELRARALTTQASVLIDMGQLSEIHPLYEQALSLLQGSDYYDGVIAARSGLAALHLRRGEPRQALTQLDGLFEPPVRVTDQRWQVRVLRQRSQALRALGELEGALDCLERAHQIEAEAVKAEAAERLQQLRVHHEVSAARREAARLERARRELERQIEARTLSLHEAIAQGARSRLAREELEVQLLAAQKMGAVGLLAGGIAHDFNNVLMVVSSYAELLLESAAGEEAEAAREILRASALGERLTGQLAALVRRRDAHIGLVTIDALVRDFGAMLSGVLSSQLELVVRLGAPRLLVHIDPTHIEQILLNLILNARDAIDRYGQITVSTRQEQRAGPLGWPVAVAVLRVADSGSGISPDVLSQIFEPLFTTKSPGHGTGLGLSTVRAIVQRAGGEIEVGSTLGEGTAFEVRLPAAEAQPEASASAPGPPLLVVATDSAVRAVLVGTLSSAGYPASAADDAAHAAALSTTRGEPVSLTIAALPAAQLRELEQRGAAPVLDISCLRPLTPAGLLQAVAAALR